MIHDNSELNSNQPFSAWKSVIKSIEQNNGKNQPLHHPVGALRLVAVP